MYLTKNVLSVLNDVLDEPHQWALRGPVIDYVVCLEQEDCELAIEMARAYIDQPYRQKYEAAYRAVQQNLSIGDLRSVTFEVQRAPGIEEIVPTYSRFWSDLTTQCGVSKDVPTRSAIAREIIDRCDPDGYFNCIEYYLEDFNELPCLAREVSRYREHLLGADPEGFAAAALSGDRDAFLEGYDPYI